MSGPAVITIAASNYLPHVRVLAASLRQYHPAIPVFAVVTGPSHPGEVEGVEELKPRSLGLRDPDARRRRYGTKALCASLKAAALQYLLRSGFEPACFLDPDILVTAPLDPVFEEAARRPFTLIPHWLAPPAHPRLRLMVRQLALAGVCNGGFVAASATPETMAFLGWWDARLATQCVLDLGRGIHYDQRWLDLAPCFVPGLHLLRDPGCNVAYWNLPDRRLEASGDGWQIDGTRLRFFHFSGFDPLRPEEISRFVPGWDIDSLGAAAALFRLYANRLREAGWAAAQAL